SFSQKTAVGAHERVDLVSDFSLVTSLATSLTDQPQSLRQVRIFENVALRRSAALAVESVGFEKPAGQSFVKPGTKRPVIRDQVCNWKTFLGVANRRGEVVAQFQFAKSFVQLRPCVDATGNADRQHAYRRNRVAMQLHQFGFHLIVSQAKRGTAAPVDAVKRIFFRAINDGE